MGAPPGGILRDSGRYRGDTPRRDPYQAGAVPLAAGGLALVIVFHLTRGEFGLMVGPLGWFSLVAFVGNARLKLAPIAPRKEQEKN